VLERMICYIPVSTPLRLSQALKPGINEMANNGSNELGGDLAALRQQILLRNLEVLTF
jgi:hypothetical protein